MGAYGMRLTGVVVGIVGAAMLLTGCGAPVVTPKPAATTPTPTPSASTEPTPVPITADVLFVISANVRSVGGRTIGISMAVHAPLASTDPAAKDLKNKFLSVCSAGNGAQPIDDKYLIDNGSTLLLAELTSNTADEKFAAPIELFFGSPYYAQAAIGSGVTPTSGGQTCFSGYQWRTSGTVRGIADFENSDGTPDLAQWRFGHYGFTLSPDSGATIEACKVIITDVGMKTGIQTLPGWDPSQAATGVSCGVGYSGE